MGVYWKMEENYSSNVGSDSSVFTSDSIKHIYSIDNKKYLQNLYYKTATISYLILALLELPSELFVCSFRDEKIKINFISFILENGGHH